MRMHFVERKLTRRQIVSQRRSGQTNTRPFRVEWFLEIGDGDRITKMMTGLLSRRVDKLSVKGSPFIVEITGGAAEDEGSTVAYEAGLYKVALCDDHVKQILDFVVSQSGGREVWPNFTELDIAGRQGSSEGLFLVIFAESSSTVGCRVSAIAQRAAGGPVRVF